MPKELHKKLYLILTPLVGIALTLFLLKSFFFNRNVTKNIPVSFSISQEPESVAPNTNFKLLLNPGSHKVSFVRVRLHFDPGLIQLSDEINIADSPLKNVIQVTPMAEANSSGSVEIVVARNPGAVTFQNAFQIAELMFTKNSDEPSDLTLVDEDTQVVDDNSNVLPFTANSATVNLN